MWCRNSTFESWFPSSSLVESGIKKIFRHVRYDVTQSAFLKFERLRFCYSSTVQWSESWQVWFGALRRSCLTCQVSVLVKLRWHLCQYILHVMEASPFGWILKELGLTMQCTKWSPVWLMLAIWLSAQLQVWFCKYLLTSLSQGGTSDIQSWINSTWPKLLL